MTSIFSICLVAFLCLFGCGQASPHAKDSDSYTFLNTGLPKTFNYCWYDDRRLIVLYKPVAPTGRPQLKGLFYLDVANPTKLVSLDLAPLSKEEQGAIQWIKCQEGTLLVFVPGTGWLARRVYQYDFDKPTELLVDMRLSGVSLAGGYVVGTSPIIEKGTIIGHDDCAQTYVKPGLKVLCWNKSPELAWPHPKFVVTRFRWDKTVRVRGTDGQVKSITNPTPPLPDEKGNPRYGALVVRDFKGNIIRDLYLDPNLGKFGGASLVEMGRDHQFLYAGCVNKKDGERGTDRGCRLPLNDLSSHWEEMFAVDPTFRGTVMLNSMSSTLQGDAFFTEAAVRGKRLGIWQYKSQTKELVRITVRPEYRIDERVKVSPNGRVLAFLRNDFFTSPKIKGAKLMLAVKKGRTI